MLKTKTAVIIDSLFVCIISFVLLLLWLSNFIKNAFFLFFICNLIIIFEFVVILKSNLKKHNLSKLKFKELEKIKKYFNYLAYSSFVETKIFFEKLLNAKYLKYNFYQNKQSIFYINIKRKLNAEDFEIANNYYWSTNKNLPLSFICIDSDAEFLNILKNSPTKFNLYNFNDISELISINKIDLNFNKEYSNSNCKLKTIKEKFSLSLTKNHFKDFFVSGLSLIAISFFIPFSTYYKITGTLLLILSIISLFNRTKVLKVKDTSLVSLINKKDV